MDAAVRFEIVQDSVHFFQEFDVGVPKRDGDVVIQIRVEDERIQNAKSAFGMCFPVPTEYPIRYDAGRHLFTCHRRENFLLGRVQRPNWNVLFV